jgi:hypothetical protein
MKPPAQRSARRKTSFAADIWIAGQSECKHKEKIHVHVKIDADIDKG